jgi:preprotein translocase subunit SecG
MLLIALVIQLSPDKSLGKKESGGKSNFFKTSDAKITGEDAIKSAFPNRLYRTTSIVEGLFLNEIATDAK